MYGYTATLSGNLGTTDNRNKYGIYSYVTGTADTNYGIYGYARGATKNYAGYFSGNVSVVSGNLGVGTEDANNTLEVRGNISTYNLTVVEGITLGGSYKTTWPGEVTNSDVTANISQLKTTITSTNNSLESLNTTFQNQINTLNITKIQNGSDATLNDLSASDMYLSSNLYHEGDEDTYMLYTTDRYFLTVGNVIMVDTLEDDSQDQFTINPANTDVDFIIYDDTDTALYIKGNTGNIGIGTPTPAHALEIAGGGINATMFNASEALCMGGNCQTDWDGLTSSDTTTNITTNTISIIDVNNTISSLNNTQPDITANITENTNSLAITTNNITANTISITDVNNTISSLNITQPDITANITENANNLAIATQNITTLNQTLIAYMTIATQNITTLNQTLIAYMADATGNISTLGVTDADVTTNITQLRENTSSINHSVMNLETHATITTTNISKKLENNTHAQFTLLNSTGDFRVNGKLNVSPTGGLNMTGNMSIAGDLNVSGGDIHGKTVDLDLGETTAGRLRVRAVGLELSGSGTRSILSNAQTLSIDGYRANSNSLIQFQNSHAGGITNVQMEGGLMVNSLTTSTYGLQVQNDSKAMNVSNLLFVDTGRVGISTNSPTQPLSVAGGVNISGGLNVTEEICLAGTCKSSWAGLTASDVTANITANTISIIDTNNTISSLNDTQPDVTTNITQLRENASSINSSVMNLETFAGIATQNITTLNTSIHWEKTGTSIFPSTLTDKVGIGTESPTADLEVSDTTGGWIKLGTLVSMHDNTLAPNITMLHSDAGLADDLIIGSIIFLGEDDNGDFNRYGVIKSRAIGVSEGDEDGSIELSVLVDGSENKMIELDGQNKTIELVPISGKVGIGTQQPGSTLEVNGNVSFNNTLFVKSTYNGTLVGIGTDKPNASLHIGDSIDGYRSALMPQLLLESGEDNFTRIEMYSEDKSAVIGYGASTVTTFDGFDDTFIILVNLTSDDQEGDVALRVNGTTADVTVQNKLGVGIGSTTPKHVLEVEGPMNATSLNVTTELCIAGTCKGSWNGLTSSDTTANITENTNSLAITTNNITANTISIIDTNNTISSLNDTAPDITANITENTNSLAITTNNITANTISIIDTNNTISSLNDTAPDITTNISKKLQNNTDAQFTLLNSTGDFSINGRFNVSATGALNMSENLTTMASIGIGTTTPGYLFHVVGAAGTYTKIESVGATAGQYLTSDTNEWSVRSYGTGSAYDQKFGIQDGTDVRLAIDTSGRVGIRDPTPSHALEISGGGVNATMFNASEALCVGGDCVTDWDGLTASDVTANITALNTYTTIATANITSNTDIQTAYMADATPNITTALVTDADVTANISKKLENNTHAQFTLLNSTGDFSVNGGFNVSATGQLNLSSNLRIGDDFYFNTTSGKLGIGTASPNATLHVIATLSDAANNVITGSTFVISNAASTYGIHFRNRGNSAGISGSTYTQQIYSATVGNGMEIYTMSGDLVLGADETEGLRIDSATQNIGIGTTTPNTTLEISGDTNISETLEVKGGITLGGTYKDSWDGLTAADVTANITANTISIIDTNNTHGRRNTKHNSKHNKHNRHKQHNIQPKQHTTRRNNKHKQKTRKQHTCSVYTIEFNRRS